MSMIAEISRLKELQASDASATYKTEEKEFQYECEMLNAAPAMLDALWHVRPGDTKKLLWIGENLMCSKMFRTYRDMEHCNACVGKQDCDVLRRLQAMCQKMEES